MSSAPRLISFHAVSVEFFDDTIGPLVSGGKINPESFVEAATRIQRTDWRVKGYRMRLERLLESLTPPPPPAEGTLWTKLRARLEQFDYKPDPVARRIEGKLDPELHLWGRPFLVVEHSAERVSLCVDDYGDAADDAAVDSLVLQQLLRIDPKLPSELEPLSTGEPAAEMTYRNELLDRLKAIHAMARGGAGGADGTTPLLTTGPAGSDRAAADLPWLAVWLHSRAHPFWIGRDIDGLESVCHAAGIEPPAVLVPCWRLFSAGIERFPELRDSLTAELQRDEDVGGFVAPTDVPELIAFLNQYGSRIIQAATREGVGAICSAMLKKVRECAHHAQRHGRGYLEASGIFPVSFRPEDLEPDDEEYA